MRELPLKDCPVPSEQQPVNEYEQLKESWFFRWATLETVNYWRKLAWVWLVAWLLVSPIAAASFPWQKAPGLFALSSSIGAGAIAALVWLRLLLGWYYVRDRLKAETVFYEESGWYDGQTWQKPPAMLVRDRLIVSYQVDSVVQRLKGTAVVLVVLIIAGSAIWLFFY